MEDRWIQEYGLREGSFDITKVDRSLVLTIPNPRQVGKVYMRLISDTLGDNESYVDGIIRVYNDPICETIDNYNGSAYFEPSYVVARAYYAREF